MPTKATAAVAVAKVLPTLLLRMMLAAAPLSAIEIAATKGSCGGFSPGANVGRWLSLDAGGTGGATQSRLFGVHDPVLILHERMFI